MTTREKPLSERAKLLLALIRENTQRDDTGELALYWIPRAKPQHCELANERVDVHGPGDAQALEGLRRRGLIANVKCSVKYAYVCTEDGMLYYENVLRAEWADRS